MSLTEYREDIINYLNKHPELNDKPSNEIAKSMILEALWNTPFAEDAYPGVKEKLIKIVEEM